MKPRMIKMPFIMGHPQPPLLRGIWEEWSSSLKSATGAEILKALYGGRLEKSTRFFLEGERKVVSRIPSLDVPLGYGIRGKTQVNLTTSSGNKIERLAIRERDDL